VRQRVLDLLRVGDAMFSQRMPLMTLWQVEAENFHVMRADFTRARYPNEEFASYLMSGRPAMAHREMKNAVGAMLRPRDQQWLHARTLDEKVNKDLGNKRYLDWLSEQQRRWMYDRRASFTRAAKELDGDWTAFGNGVMTCEPRRELDGLIFRTWHLRDCAWSEDSYNEINQIHRNWEPQGFELQKLWPNSISQHVANLKNEEKLKKIQCRHIVLRADEYDLPVQKTRGRPWVSVYIDKENQTILEEKPIKRRQYVIPRWEFVSNSIMGTPYAYSPATVYGLPDARMFQQMTLTLLEAGQKSVDPPMIAVGEAINGGTNLFAGGITWTDADYDERMGEVLRPMQLEFRGLQFGAAREERLEKILQEVFFNSALQFPTITKEMTATESQRLYEEFIRKAIPLIEPMAEEYNGQVCEMAFDTLLDMGAFGSPYDMPQQLRGQEIRFQFDTPLQAAAERAKAQAFKDSCEIVVTGAQIDPSVAANFDINTATRDALYGAGSPAEWILPPDQVAAKLKQQQQMQQLQAAQQAVAHGTDMATRIATAAKSGGEAAQALQQAGGQ
jgi:Bacteriophage head to tail connecting protein